MRKSAVEQDLEALTAALNKIQTRKELHKQQNVHPKFDWANLRIHLTDVAYCVEWHDRLWPEDKRPQIGFIRDGEIK